MVILGTSLNLTDMTSLGNHFIRIQVGKKFFADFNIDTYGNTYWTFTDDPYCAKMLFFQEEVDAVVKVLEGKSIKLHKYYYYKESTTKL